MYPVETIRDLIDKLNHYRDAYYNKNISEISVKEYDEMFDKLSKLEEEYRLVYADSPTQSVGYQVVSGLKKVKHNHPMLSLDKTTDEKEFVEYFFEGTEYQGNTRGVVLMAKLDGLTASLTYQDGKLVAAETRGDGEIGEDILHNVLTFANIPKKIDSFGTVTIDGECIIDTETFKEINEKEHTEYKHPRNLASGTVRQLDSAVCARRKVRFVAWRLVHALDLGSKPWVMDNFMSLKRSGFEVVPYVYFSRREDFKEAKDKILKMVEELHYPIDGLVGTFDYRIYADELGATSHHPRHSYAFKFYQEENRTILRDIEWNTTRSGRINPTAVFDPIEIDGTTVSRASLFNVSVIEDLELGIGDEISVIKANQIIPHIVENYTRSGPMSIPQYCPNCFSETKIEDDNGRKVLVCSNDNCSSKKIDMLCHFVSREGMNIEGFSDATIELLYNVGYITDYPSIFKLPELESKIAKLEGMGEVSAHNLVEAVNKAKTCSLSSVLTALGIPGVGKSTARDIAGYLSKSADLISLMCLAKSTILDTGFPWFNYIEGIGEKTSNNINTYLKQHEDMLRELASVLTVTNDKTTKNSLQGKIFGITGNLHLFENREALISDIVHHGGQFHSTVTSRTKYLISNEGANSTSTKTKKALALGVQIITEEEYQALKG